MKLTPTPARASALALACLAAAFIAPAACTGILANTHNAPHRLTVESRVDPVGIDTATPRFSWWLGDTRPGAVQSACEIEIETLAPDGRSAVGKFTAKLDTSASVDVTLDLPSLAGPIRPPAGFIPQPATRYRWRVRTCDAAGAPSAWSAPAHFETGLMHNAAWRDSAWISHPPRDNSQSVPPAHLRTTFSLDPAKPVARARLYATARGMFQAWINGRRVGDDYFTPGWTDYARTNQYLVYDVTAQLQRGKNCLGAILGDGWYAGFFGLGKTKTRPYGPEAALRMRLEIIHTDGSRSVIATGDGWRVSTGPIRSSDIYNGEHYDARRELGPWSAPAYDDTAWTPARVLADDPGAERLVGKIVQPVRVTQTLAPVSVKKIADGAWIFDFGQNMVGVPRLALAGRAGQTVTLRYAEMLNDDGTLYTANYRAAKSTDSHTFARDGRAEWTPAFTFHGFRYIELSGLDAPPPPGALAGLVLHNDMERTGEFVTSHPLINQLQSNITWGQRGNFLEVPTDCPQRDERLGWTGDAQIFARTAAFNYDVRAFFEKWMADLRDAQLPDGGVPNYIPSLGTTRTAAAWGDAVTIVPWAIFQCLGDKRILADNYDAMKRWLDYLEKNSTGHIRPAQGYGDWVALDKPNPKKNDDTNTPKDLLATAYYAHSADITARTAAILGRHDEARRYRQLREDIRAAFVKTYITPEGAVAGGTQTSNLLALAFDLAPPEHREKITAALVADIEARGWHLSTGFVGTGILMPTLSARGRDDVAFRLLMQETYPSWLYSIHQGATTIWERWNSYTKDKGFGPVSMNSFNHYAYGVVGEWMYATIGGLRAEEPGYKKTLIKPIPGGGLTHARATLKTPYGILSSEWKIADGHFELKTTVPPNTTATIELPDGTRHPAAAGTRAWRVKWPAQENKTRATPAKKPSPGITKQPFGEARGQPVDLYTLTNKNGMVVKITNYGGIITELHTPDRNGKPGDVVLGFDNVADYIKPSPYFGTIVGRYGNRIAAGKFTLDGAEYTLATNNGKNHLHGGNIGFNKKVWSARVIENATAGHGNAGVPPAGVAQTAKSAKGRANPPGEPLHGTAQPEASPYPKATQIAKSADEAKPRPIVNRNGIANAVALELTHTSHDGDEGYPGNLRATVAYTLTDDNELIIDYHAVTDKPTPCNLTNHSFFNLSAGRQPTVDNHVVAIFADNYVEVNDTLIPTGRLPAVAGTPMDFTAPRRVGERVDADFEQLKFANGYDHTWVLRKPAAAPAAPAGSAGIPPGGRREAPSNPPNPPNPSNPSNPPKPSNPPSGNLALPDSAVAPILAATVYEPESGRFMEVFTTEPGVQFFTGNGLSGSVTGKYNIAYPRRGGLCLETQHFPDSPNQPSFPSTILRPGQTYRTRTIYKFSAR